MTPDKSRGLLDRVGDAVLEPVEDHLGRFNAVCTHIAIVMLGGIAAIAFVAEVIR